MALDIEWLAQRAIDKARSRRRPYAIFLQRGQADLVPAGSARHRALQADPARAAMEVAVVYSGSDAGGVAGLLRAAQGRAA